MQEIAWEQTKIEELDISGTELKSEALLSTLSRLSHLRWLKAGFLENFTDEVGFNFSFEGYKVDCVYLYRRCCVAGVSLGLQAGCNIWTWTPAIQ